MVTDDQSDVSLAHVSSDPAGIGGMTTSVAPPVTNEGHDRGLEPAVVYPDDDAVDSRWLSRSQRFVIVLMAVLAVGLVLWFYVFPWIQQRLPANF